MKANKIMLGDWVNYRPGWIDEETGEPVFDSKKGFPVKIDFIGGEDGGAQYSDEYGSYEMADFEMSPIPLTPEILEKNGFKKEGPAPQGVQVWAVRYDEKRFRIFEWVASESFVLHDINIRSVHELQHALRLCGIEKEIVL